MVLEKRLSSFLADNGIAFLASNSGGPAEMPLHDYGIFDRMVERFGKPAVVAMLVQAYPKFANMIRETTGVAEEGAIPEVLRDLAADCEDVFVAGVGFFSCVDAHHASWSRSRYAPYVSLRDVHEMALAPRTFVTMWRLGMFGNPPA